MYRELAIDLISEKLGVDRLIWIGSSRLETAHLLAYPQFSHSFAAGPTLGDPRITEYSLESLVGLRQRQDPSFASMAAGLLLTKFLRDVSPYPGRILTYAPHPFYQTLVGGSSALRLMGPSWDLFWSLSSKSNVERGLRDTTSLNLIPWQALPESASRLDTVGDELMSGPVVLRTDASAGGVGHELLLDKNALLHSRLIRETPLSFAPYFDGALSVTVGACVFRDGGVTIHPPAVQLLGVSECTNLDFGYCGNDFGAIKGLEPGQIENLESMARTVGGWLHSKGFLGAFGVDALIHKGDMIFMEVNPRFQASSWMGARIDVEAGIPDMWMNHLLACLGFDAPASMPLVERVAAQPALSQVLCHNQSNEWVVMQGEMALPESISMEMMPEQSVQVAPDNLLFILTTDTSVTGAGRQLRVELSSTINALKNTLRPVRKSSRRPPAA